VRVTQYRIRNREFDTVGGTQQKPIVVITYEEEVFQIMEAISLSDTLIENHEVLPHVIEVSLFEGLVRKGFVAVGTIDQRIQLPMRGRTGSTKEPVLLREEIEPLLTRFSVLNQGKHIFVIQGGNRYMFSYLAEQLVREVASIKLLDVGKVKISVVLNTLLFAHERVSPISKDQKDAILSAFVQLPVDRKDEIIPVISARGFPSLSAFLKYTTIGEALKVFGDFTIPSPFSYPADDRKIRQEFAAALPFALQTINSNKGKEMLKALIVESSFYKAVSDQVRQSAFLDDVFYRGRTYYTLVVLSLLLDVPLNRWKLYTLCADRVSKEICTEGIEVLKRGVLYPFENSIQTEKGYWEECDDCFVFRDMILYAAFLSATITNRPELSTLAAQWNRIVDQIRKATGYHGLSRQTVNILVEFYIFCIVHDRTLYVDAILDQRAKGIGFCVPFVKAMAVWINQEEHRWKRQQYKDKVRACFTAIRSVNGKETWHLLDTATNFYRQYGDVLDYVFLQEFYGVQ
jgi:hypothetical protein